MEETIDKILSTKDLADEKKSALRKQLIDTFSTDAEAKDEFMKNPEAAIDKILNTDAEDDFDDDPTKTSDKPEHTIELDESGSITPDYDASTPEEADKEKSTKLKTLAERFPTIAQEFGSRFRSDPDAAENLADFALNVFNSPKWVEWMKGKEKDKAIIQNKIIPTLVNAYNQRNKGAEITLPKQVNDDTREALQDRNGNKSTSIVVPEGFNKGLIELGDQAVSTDIGYPMVNFNSVLIKEIVHETDKKRLKKLLKALVKKLEGTPTAEVFLKRGFIGTIKASLLYKLIDQAKDAKGIPMIRRPLKVPSEELVGNSESEMISVIPVNNLGNETKDPSKIEAVNLYDLTPLYESFQNASEQEILYENWFNGKIDTSSKNKYGAPKDIPKVYLQQYYTILTPSGASGLTRYASYLTDVDKKNMMAKLDQNDVEAIKSSNRNVNDALIAAYLKKTNGVPPFYILIARSNPTKERLRVCDEIKLGKNICIKSIDGRNKDAYYIPEDVVDAIFEAG